MQASMLLTKAIVRAERNGFDLYAWWEEYMASPVPDTLEVSVEELLEHHNWEKLLFAPAFARSLWGGDELWENGEKPLWTRYLSSLAAADAERRIRYLKVFLSEAHS